MQHPPRNRCYRTETPLWRKSLLLCGLMGLAGSWAAPAEAAARRPKSTPPTAATSAVPSHKRFRGPQPVRQPPHPRPPPYPSRQQSAAAPEPAGSKVSSPGAELADDVPVWAQKRRQMRQWQAEVAAQAASAQPSAERTVAPAPDGVQSAAASLGLGSAAAPSLRAGLRQRILALQRQRLLRQQQEAQQSRQEDNRRQQVNDERRSQENRQAQLHDEMRHQEIRQQENNDEMRRQEIRREEINQQNRREEQQRLERH
jgi:hypothetical protein